MSDKQHPSLSEIEARYADPLAPINPQVLRMLQRDPRSGARRLYLRLAKRYEQHKGERIRLDAMLHFERLLWKAGVERIAGVDEVGIGPLAGPVVAAAVVFPPNIQIAAIDDSKVLKEETRSRLDTEIRSKASAVGIGAVDVAEVDRLNVYQAGLRAMQLAIADLAVAPQHVLVDARTIPGVTQPQNAFEKGDGINFSIAAASIVAKVYRDRVMTELDAQYPGYGFAGHKGYATPEHQAAIRELGPCPIHRRSFAYIRELCGEYSALYYRLKGRAAQVKSRSSMAAWERELQEGVSALSEMENRKLQLLKNRLWRRLSA